MENKKSFEKMADEAIDAVTGGTGKLASGWICARCGQEVTAAKAKNNNAYCIPCYRKLFGDPMA